MTLQKIALLGASVAAICLPATTQAATAAHAAAGVDTDARCIAVGMAMAHAQDPRVRGMGAQTLTYFYGRLQAKPARGDLEARIATQIVALQAEKAGANSSAQSCINEVEANFKTLSPVLDRLTKRFGHPAPAPAAGAAPVAPAPLTPAH